MSKSNDEVQLARNCKQWPVDVAEKLLANPSPWGPPTYVFGQYIDDPNQPDQSDVFFELAHCVDGAYNRHDGEKGDAWNWANSIINSIQEGGSCTEYMTQDLLDIVFLCSRLERFCDGFIRSKEPILREMMREVVRRVHSSPSPVFLTQK